MALVALLTLAGLAFGASPAAAHARLVATEPADGARLSEPPSEVVLTFDEDVHVGAEAVQVVRGSGEPVSTHELAPERRRIVVAELPRLDAGSYTVFWRVTSIDADPLTGRFSFSVGAALPPSDEQVRSEALPMSDTDRGASAVKTAARFTAFAAMVLFVGVCLHSFVLQPRRTLTSRGRALLSLSTVLLVVSGVLAVGAGAAAAAGAGLSSATDPDVVRPFLRTTPARAAVVRVLVASAVLVAVRRRAWWARYVVSIAGLVIVATFVASGHAISGSLVPLAMIADLVHLAAAGVWIGGLVSLLVLGGTHERVATRRFSTIAAWAVASIVVTGSFAAWRQLRSMDRLAETEYGRTLLVKLALVSTLLALGAASRRLVRRSRRGRLARVVLAEAVVAVLVLAATTALVGTAPRAAPPSSGEHTPEATRPGGR